MNKLGISDTDSVEKVEQHFIRLGESGHHGDLGEGNTSEEQLRLHGLQARSCVKHAVTCSHMAASCHATPKHCKVVVENCSRAAAACGVEDVGESEKAKEEKIVEQPNSIRLLPQEEGCATQGQEASEEEGTEEESESGQEGEETCSRDRADRGRGRRRRA